MKRRWIRATWDRQSRRTGRAWRVGSTRASEVPELQILSHLLTHTTSCISMAVAVGAIIFRLRTPDLLLGRYLDKQHPPEVRTNQQIAICGRINSMWHERSLLCRLPRPGKLSEWLYWMAPGSSLNRLERPAAITQEDWSEKHVATITHKGILVHPAGPLDRFVDWILSNLNAEGILHKPLTPGLMHCAQMPSTWQCSSCAERISVEPSVALL